MTAVQLGDEHEELFPGQLRDLPFEGVTIAKLRLINSALYGHVVWVHKLAARGSREPVHGVFLGCAVPGTGMGGYGLPPTMGDLLIGISWNGEDAVGSGHAQVLGMGLVTSFDVVTRTAWHQCERCGLWRPRARLTWAWWGTNGADDWDRDGPLVCAREEDGYCA